MSRGSSQRWIKGVFDMLDLRGAFAVYDNAEYVEPVGQVDIIFLEIYVRGMDETLDFFTIYGRCGISPLEGASCFDFCYDEILSVCCYDIQFKVMVFPSRMENFAPLPYQFPASEFLSQFSQFAAARHRLILY